MAIAKLSKYIKRYTKLEHAIAALKSQELVLPNPSSWDDSNDQEFVKLYRRHISAKSVYAMCCTMGAERYHHWRIFTRKSEASGVCLEFRRTSLQRAVNRLPHGRAQPVEYVPMNELNAASGYRPNDLPFIKRIGYSDEREWRMLVTSPEPQEAFSRIGFRLAWLHRIILNPWMTERQRREAREILMPLIERPTRITSSFLTNSARWKKLGKELIT